VASRQEQIVPATAGRDRQVFYGAFALSTFAHLTAIVLCALFLIDAQPRFPAIDVLSLTAPDERIEFQRDPLDLKQPDFSLETSPGSSPATAVALANRPVKLNRVTAPVLAVPVTRDVLDSGELVSGLAERVESHFSGVGGRGTGTGQGHGDGGGDSAGKGFFGQESDAKSVVFVVDCSSSMNTRHKSEWKTRFGRVKYEMLKSVAAMSPEQRFYIIFFNTKPIRMPARGLLAATPEAKKGALTWMVRQSATGHTDPRTALGYALRLQPDMVYFLTDGSFEPRVKRGLLAIQQYNVAIHTFVFGNPAGEKVMKQIAVQNRGKYTYIP
jgi:hypothetical protein